MITRRTTAKLAATAIATILALAGAPPAVAADEQGFITAIRALDHYALDCPRCNQDAITVGYQACTGFDTGGNPAAIKAVRTAYNADTSENAEYYATLFAQYAGTYLCPAHARDIGPI